MKLKEKWFLQKAEKETLENLISSRVLKIHLMDNYEKNQRILYSDKSGLIIHSSALVYDTLAVVFLGISESGKSTIAFKLNGVMTPINDEKNILEFSEKGIVVKSFFPKRDGQIKEYLINHDLTGVLKAVLFPVKEYEKDSFIEQLSDKGLIWRKLLTCVAPPAEGHDYLFPNYYAMIDKLMDSVPFFNFYHNLKDSPEFIADILKSIK